MRKVKIFYIENIYIYDSIFNVTSIDFTLVSKMVKSSNYRRQRSKIPEYTAFHKTYRKHICNTHLIFTLHTLALPKFPSL